MVAACLLLTACGDTGGTNESVNATNAAGRAPVPRLPLPAPEPSLNREQLMIAALRAASDFEAGFDDSRRQKDLAGRKFEFRIRFGCGGPQGGGDAAPFGWSVNENSGALKVRATPQLSADDTAVEAIAGEDFEAVEGFWIDRPWQLAAHCPRKQEAAAPAEAQSPKRIPEQIVGIAQFFTAAEPRTMRRSGRPYEATKRLADGDRPAAGFDLILTGQLKALPDGRVIACTQAPAGGRPACVISVEFGRVAIARGDTHEELAHWGTG